MPEKLQPEVFGRFVRADHARSRSTGSTGLAIVHAVITAHGGTATVTSSPGHTTFRLTLPD
ncbi:ATP-binding protein [Streptomyces sp. NPDC058545]|uniref:ATP-binding protein n=1 Tax=Streptomyces sp. NPDC058545 TaxID=3346544 RepID=UPI00365FFBA7